MNSNEFSLFIGKGLKRVPYAEGLARRYNRRRHERIERQIRPLCEQVQKKLIDTAPGKHSETRNDGPIWVFWWQGEHAAPRVVRVCVETMRRHAANRDVVIITKDNIREYCNLPDYIYEKVDNHSITLTHFSDIVRFNLLHHHGGLWMDATLYVANALNEDRCFGSFYTCSGFDDPTHFFVTEGKWTGFFIGGSADESLFAFMNSFFLCYWKTNSELIDYFLIDYALRYAYEHRIGSLWNWVRTQNGKDDPKLFDLAPLLAKEYDLTVWERLTSDTSVFKLSWKKPTSFPRDSFGDALINKFA